jgi:hypothetical protein
MRDISVFQLSNGETAVVINHFDGRNIGMIAFSAKKSGTGIWTSRAAIGIRALLCTSNGQNMPV